MTKARVIERVKKLLAKASDASSPEEAAIAASMAEKTMRKYQIENYEVTLADQEAGATVEDYQYGPKVVPAWASQLAAAVGKLNEVLVYRVGGVGKLRYVGADVDVFVAVEMTKYLVDTINRLAKKFKGGRRGNNSFRLGAVDIVVERLLELMNEREADFSDRKDLIVCKDALIDAWVQKSGLKLRRKKPRNLTVDPDAYSAGQVAGASISLNKQITP